VRTPLLQNTRILGWDAQSSLYPIIAKICQATEDIQTSIQTRTWIGDSHIKEDQLGKLTWRWEECKKWLFTIYHSKPTPFLERMQATVEKTESWLLRGEILHWIGRTQAAYDEVDVLRREVATCRLALSTFDGETPPLKCDNESLRASAARWKQRDVLSSQLEASRARLAPAILATCEREEEHNIVIRGLLAEKRAELWQEAIREIRKEFPIRTQAMVRALQGAQTMVSDTEGLVFLTAGIAHLKEKEGAPPEESLERLRQFYNGREDVLVLIPKCLA
jgi:hypothetical protein